MNSPSLPESSPPTAPLRPDPAVAGAAAMLPRWRQYAALTKPRVMSLVIFTGLCGLLAAPGTIHPVIGFTAILCIAMGAGDHGYSLFVEADDLIRAYDATVADISVPE